MDERYYIRFKGRVLGPMSAEKTQELIRRGQITRVHELSPDGIEWRKAEEFSEFYPKKSIVEKVTNALASQEIIAPQTKPEWYAHIDGQNVGPVDESALRQWVSNGKVTKTCLIWKEGMGDWQAAELAKPDLFRANVYQPSAGAQSSGDAPIETYCFELRKRAFWIYSTAIVGIIVFSLQIAAYIFGLISQIVAPADSGDKVIVGLFGNLILMAFASLGLATAIQLLRYANSVSVLKHAVTSANMSTALKRLSTFWMMLGTYILATILFFTLVGLLLYAGLLRSFYLIAN